MSIFKTTIILGLAATAGAAAFAQEDGKRSKARKPIETISGSVGQIAENRFMLQASRGPLLVTAGPSWHHKLDVKNGEKVEVTGEVGALEIDAFSIKREDGQVVEIRPEDGPPPWAVAEMRDKRKGPPEWARGERRDWRDDDEDEGGGPRWKRSGPPPWAGEDRDRRRD
jgi:hypothetical protein